MKKREKLPEVDLTISMVLPPGETKGTLAKFVYRAICAYSAHLDYQDESLAKFDPDKVQVSIRCKNEMSVNQKGEI